MDEAMTIGREWLKRAGVSEDRLVAVMNTLLAQIADAPGVQHAVAADGRLALVAEKELWIGRLAETDTVTTVKIERVDLDAERVRLSLTESHDFDRDKPGVTYIWRADFEHGTEPLELRAKGQYVHGVVHVRDDDNAAHAFGWHLAEATGWTKPN